MLGVSMAQKQNQRRLVRLQSLYRAFLAEGDILINALRCADVDARYEPPGTGGHHE